MITNIIYVEDGSIDYDELVDSLDETTKVILYRQGSKPPLLVQLEKPICSFMDSVYIKQERQLEHVRKVLQDAGQLKKSKKLRKLLTDLYADLFC